MKKIIILLICFYGMCAHAQTYMLDQIVAIVGGKPIKQSAVEYRYLQYRMQGGPIQDDIKCVMFEQLLTEKLLINQAEVDSLVVEPSEVEMMLERNFDYLALNFIFEVFPFCIKIRFCPLMYDFRLAAGFEHELIAFVNGDFIRPKQHFLAFRLDAFHHFGIFIAELFGFFPDSPRVFEFVDDSLLAVRQILANRFV
jgi:hypothetical protein